MIDDRIELKVLRIKGNQVHIGIEAPRETEVHRKEVWLRLQGDEEAGLEVDEKDSGPRFALGGS